LWGPAGTAGAAEARTFGLPLAQRTLLAFVRAGVRDFTLIGDAAETARVAALFGGERFASVRIGVATAEEPLLPWLSSTGDCLLARWDCLYDRRLVARFVAETRGALTSVAAVDFRAEALRAQEGAPRAASFRAPAALAAGENLRAAGRGLVAPDGVLCGLAHLSPSFARAFADAPLASRSLENALSLLARREPVATWPVRELWQFVRAGTAERSADLLLVRRKVLAGAVGVSDGLVARHVNRPLSRRITERLVRWDRVSPWQVSLASFFTTLGAGLAFALGHATTGGIAAQLASVLHGVDGEVARIRYQDTPVAGVLDALLDRVGDAVLIGGMTLYAWLMGAGDSAIALGFAAVAGSSLSLALRESHKSQLPRADDAEREGRWRWLLLGREGRLFLTLVAGMTGYVEAVLAYLAIGTHVHAGASLLRIRSEARA
jgi:CDP-L-myo-inositol myo-inositolphosphotransferase